MSLNDQTKNDLHQKRIELWEEQLRINPSDPFNHYALALELRTVDPVGSRARLLNMVKQFPDYIPTYYQAALSLIQAGREAEAVELLRHGVARADAQADLKAANEMKSLLEELTF